MEQVYGALLSILISMQWNVDPHLPEKIETRRGEIAMIIKDANHINQCILEILIKNARTPLIKIAKSVGLSRAAVKNHIDKMEKCGVIEGYTVILGSNGVERSRSVLFDIQVSPACFNQVADALAAQEAVADLYLLSGECRLLARFVMEFSYDLDRFAQEMIYSLPGIEHVRSAFIISQLKSGGACKSRP